MTKKEALNALDRFVYAYGLDEIADVSILYKLIDEIYSKYKYTYPEILTLEVTKKEVGNMYIIRGTVSLSKSVFITKESVESGSVDMISMAIDDIQSGLQKYIESLDNVEFEVVKDFKEEK